MTNATVHPAARLLAQVIAAGARGWFFRMSSAIPTGINLG